MSSPAIDGRPRSAFWPLAFLLALVAAVKPIVFDTLDPDFFWHILVGEQLAHEGVHPLIDRLSFTTGPEAWTPYSWLAELFMKWLWDCGGYPLVLAAHAVLIALLILVMVATAREAVGDSASRASLSALIAAAGGMLFVLPWVSFRPVGMAILLLAVVMWLLQRDRRLGERSRAVWGVIPITAVATNVHLFALLVPMWIGALLAGAVVEKLRKGVERSEGVRRITRYFVLLLGSLAALACTPMLPGVLHTAFFYQFVDPLIASTFIVEMQPLYSGRFGIFLLLLAGGFGVFLFRQRKRVRAGEWGMVAIGLVLLLQHGRYAPLFALAIVYPLALTLTGVTDRRLRDGPLLYAWMLIPVALLFIAWIFPRPGAGLGWWLNRRAHAAAGYPVAAADYLEAHFPSSNGRLLNDFTTGGYLAWRFFPRYQVFVDGRTQVRTPEFWRETYLLGPVERARRLNAANADFAILEPDSPFLDILLSEQWHPVFADERGILLLPPNATTLPPTLPQ